MKEELNIKLSIPLFDKNEMINFESNLDYIIDHYIEELLDKKEKVLIDEVILKQKQKIKCLKAINESINNDRYKYQKEISRLNNIINELEKTWKEQQEHYRYYKDNRYRTFLSKNLEKLKKLKGE